MISGAIASTVRFQASRVLFVLLCAGILVNFPVSADAFYQERFQCVRDTDKSIIEGTRWVYTDVSVAVCIEPEWLAPYSQWFVKNLTSDTLEVKVVKKYELGSGRWIERECVLYSLKPGEQRKGGNFVYDEACLTDYFFKDEYPNGEWQIRRYGVEVNTRNLAQEQRMKDEQDRQKKAEAERQKALEEQQRAAEAERQKAEDRRKAEQAENDRVKSERDQAEKRRQAEAAEKNRVAEEREQREYRAAERRRTEAEARAEAERRRIEGARDIVRDSGSRSNERADEYTHAARDADRRLAAGEAETQRWKSETREAQRESERELRGVHNDNVAAYESQAARADDKLNRQVQAQADRQEQEWVSRSRASEETVIYEDDGTGEPVQGASANLCRKKGVTCKTLKTVGSVTVKYAIVQNEDGTWCLAWQLKNSSSRQAHFVGGTVVKLSTGEEYVDDQFGAFDVLLAPRQEVWSDCESGPFCAVYESRPVSISISGAAVK